MPSLPGLLAVVWFWGRRRWDQLTWPTPKAIKMRPRGRTPLSCLLLFFQLFHSSVFSLFSLFLQMSSVCPLSFPSRPKLPVLCLDKADLQNQKGFVKYYFQNNFILGISRQVCPNAKWNPGEKKAVNHDVHVIQWQRSQIFFWLIHPTVDMA